MGRFGHIEGWIGLLGMLACSAPFGGYVLGC